MFLRAAVRCFSVDMEASCRFVRSHLYPRRPGYESLDFGNLQQSLRFSLDHRTYVRYDRGMLGTMARPTDRLEYFFDLDVSALCDSEVRERFVEVRGLIDRLEASAARLLAAVHH